MSAVETVWIPGKGIQTQKVVEIPAEKRCPKCEQTKPASQFYRTKKYGLHSYCILCDRQRNLAYYRKTNPLPAPGATPLSPSGRGAGGEGEPLKIWPDDYVPEH